MTYPRRYEKFDRLEASTAENGKGMKAGIEWDRVNFLAIAKLADIHSGLRMGE
jgi:hypothetical protein